MPNRIKYTTTPTSNTIKVGSFALGVVTGVTYAPTSTTSFYNGYNVPSGGYVVYQNKATLGPSVFAPTGDTQMVNLTKALGNATATTIYDSLKWINEQNTIIAVNRDYENIVTSGLTALLDAGFTPSYPKSGTSWTDVSFSGYNGTLTNGPTFSSENGGSIVFDGTNDYVSTNYTTALTDFTFCLWFKSPDSTNDASNRLIDKNYVTGMWLGKNTNNDSNSWGGGIRESSDPYGIYLTLTDGQWHFLVSIKSGTTHTLYGDGISNTTSNTVSATALNTDNMTIGSTQELVSYFKGNIAQIQIYNRALSSSEVLQNYNAQKGRYEASFDSDAQAFITAAAITDPTQQTAINTLVVGLKADSIWTKMFAIYPIVGGTDSTHKYNLKDPRDLNAAFRLTFNGGMTHSSNGILFNGTNGWADTSALNTTYSFGVYTRSSTDNGGEYMGSQYMFSDEDGEVYASGYHVYYSYYEISDYNGAQVTTNTIKTGLSSVVYDAGRQKFYKNGTLKANNLSYPGISVPGSPIITLGIGGTNPSSIGYPYNSFSNQQIAFSFMGSVTLTNTDNTNLYTRVQAFQTTLGRQV